jgi:N-acetylglucosaminyl-diphospho-decaprenol L-rhamnosyltransferase
VPREISIVVASRDTRALLERCLRALPDGSDVIVVDAHSRDGSSDFVRNAFPHATLVALEENPGYGAVLNHGLALARGDYLLVLNADAWPLADAVERLVAFAEREPDVGIVGPRLLNPDGSLQPSVRGFPTPWRLATEYFFLRWLGRRTRLLNAFYAAGFDHRSTRDAEFVVGAAMLIRRRCLDDIGGFDPSFFMFNEEVDLCYRARSAGWRVVFCPDAEFVHVGGASTSQVWPEMYREQLRSHLRFLAKHRDARLAERTRRLLIAAMEVRAVVFGLVGRRDRRRLSADAAAWLRSAETSSLLRDVTTEVP